MTRKILAGGYHLAETWASDAGRHDLPEGFHADNLFHVVDLDLDEMKYSGHVPAAFCRLAVKRIGERTFSVVKGGDGSYSFQKVAEGSKVDHLTTTLDGHVDEFVKFLDAVRCCAFLISDAAQGTP